MTVTARLSRPRSSACKDNGIARDLDISADNQARSTRPTYWHHGSTTTSAGHNNGSARRTEVSAPRQPRKSASQNVATARQLDHGQKSIIIVHQVESIIIVSHGRSRAGYNDGGARQVDRSVSQPDVLAPRHRRRAFVSSKIERVPALPYASQDDATARQAGISARQTSARRTPVTARRLGYRSGRCTGTMASSSTRSSTSQDKGIARPLARTRQASTEIERGPARRHRSRTDATASSSVAQSRSSSGHNIGIARQVDRSTRQTYRRRDVIHQIERKSGQRHCLAARTTFSWLDKRDDAGKPWRSLRWTNAQQLGGSTTPPGKRRLGRHRPGDGVDRLTTPSWLSERERA